jgi:hypothetical protein
MAFVCDDEVEGLDRDGGVVLHVACSLIGGCDFEAGFFVEVFV